MYKITLADGTELEGFLQNGTNYVSDSEVDTSVFTEEALKTLSISDGENTITMQNAVFIQQCHYSDGWYICFREKTKRELMEERFTALIDSNSNDITDVQLALAEVYEILTGGA